jgi:hypothetical protein
VGPSDRAIGREVACRTHGRVQTWTRTDDDAPTWTADDVMAVLGDTTAEEVIVLSEAGRLHAIPVRRRPVASLQDKGSAAIGNIGAGPRGTAGHAAPPLTSSKASHQA